MIRELLLHTVVLVICLSFTGCSEPKEVVVTPTENKEKALEYVQNPELAKVILKPQQKKLSIAKDPFKPIMQYFMGVGGQEAKKNGLPTGKSGAEDVIFIGVVKMGDDARVFLKTADKSGVFKVQDKVGKYTLDSIGLNQIVLKFGDVVVIKKRGEM